MLTEVYFLQLIELNNQLDREGIYSTTNIVQECRIQILVKAVGNNLCQVLVMVNQDLKQDKVY